MTTAARMAPRSHLGIIEALRRHRLMVSVVSILYLVIYMWSIGDIVVTAADQSRYAAVPPIQVAVDWPAKLHQVRRASVDRHQKFALGRTGAWNTGTRGP